MKTKFNIVALIPARGGSQGIENKNLYPVLEKPLIQYTIEAALKSQYLSSVHLNTEDKSIRDFCSNFPIHSSYQRPASMAGDQSSISHAIIDWLTHMDKINEEPDIIVLLQPTSPLRTETLIDDAIQRFLSLEKKQSLVGVHLMKEHPYKCIKKLQNDWHYLAYPETTVSCRQMYDNDYYVINGSIYIAQVSWFKDKKTFVIENETDLFITSAREGVDVDELSDVYYVESLLQNP